MRLWLCLCLNCGPDPATGIQNWMAIDDQPTGWDAAELNKLVQTDSKIGLSDEEIFGIISKLILKLQSG